MTATIALLLLQASMHLFYAASWAMAGTLLGLQRSAALHWAGYCLLLSLGSFVFLAMPAGLPPTLGVPMANMSLLAAALLERRGVARFAQYPPRDGEGLLILSTGALALVVTGLDAPNAAMRMVMQSTLVSMVLLRMGGEMLGAIQREFGRVGAWLLAGPVVVLGIGLGARAVAVALRASHPEQSVMTADNPINVAVLLLLAAFSTLFQLSLVYLVVLRLVRKLHELSHHDALTALLNRRAWHHALLQERQRLRRTPRDTALLVVDIDHFKHLNDRHGHAVGDRALAAIARTLQATARATDAVARLGGEEFGLLLGDTDLEGARLAAERLREAVAQMQLVHDDLPLTLTVSIGAAVLPAAACRLYKLEQLQLKADAALYQAKAGGRNRVVLGVLDSGGLTLVAASA
ncbi:GGDEF domain-containing protein [Ideonella azotifigens]|uniref:GGDEF domain-containing protein n=1 Tax=Ideonella azotifigens TaxID=513160 RepID=UPI0014771E72|nr:GGDEF domain-containing protein [Ideonella azotifigens]